VSLPRRLGLAFQATGRHIRALWDGWRWTRKRNADRRALRSAHRELGKRAAAAGVEPERPGHGAVREHESALAERRAALEEARAAEAEVRSRLDARRREGQERIAALRAERDRLAAAQAETRGTLSRAESSIRDLERDLALPSEKREGRPARAALEPKLAMLRDSLPRLRSEEESARAALDGKQRELANARRSLAGDEERLEGELRAAAAAAREAEGAAAAAQSALDGSHEQLGRAVHESGAESPGVAEALGRAREISERIESGTARIRARRRLAAETRRPARIVIVSTAGSLLLLVGVLGLLGGGEDEARTASPPRAEDPEPTPDRPPGRRPDRPPAGAALRDAILALPSLAPRVVDGVTLFRPTGEIAVVSDEPSADGGRRLRVDVGVARRAGPEGEPSPETLHLLVVLDAAGRVIRGETQGRTSSDDDELARLLEQW
jgi:hypothetical protein